MREFFRPWRRKIGVATLLAACMFVGLWIRGIAIQDSLWFGFVIEKSYFSTQIQKVVTYGKVLDTLSSSAKDGIVWGRWNSGEGNLAWAPGWKTYSTQNNDFLDPFEPCGNSLDPELMDYCWSAFGIKVSKYHVWTAKADTYSFWQISHHSIILPLTALAALLLLTKPCRSPQLKTPEPTPNEGGATS